MSSTVRSSRLAVTVLVALVGPLAASQGWGCKRLASAALDHETDGGFSRVTGGAGGSGSSSGVKACELVTNAEIEAASGKKVVKRDGDGETCSWALAGAPGGAGPAALANGQANVSLQIVPEAALAVIPTFGEQTAVPGVGNKAEWTGGMAPNLRVHVKDGKVLNFLFVDPQAMMQAPGITEKKIDKNTNAVNMQYPVLEREAIAIGKAAAARF